MWVPGSALSVAPALMLTLLLSAPSPRPYVVVLGVAQDAGYPQAGTKASSSWAAPLRRLPACLALVSPATRERWLFEATPAFPEQLHRLDMVAPHPGTPGLAGIFLTHGHIGHYTGLMYLGREAMSSRRVPVFVMPRMRSFLRENGPWDLLVTLENIRLREMRNKREVRLTDDLTVEPFLVPHRDEYTETVGFIIRGPSRSVAFVPDIDKWSLWQDRERNLEWLLARVDVAYLDGTFFNGKELPGRSMADIPHPSMVETMARLKGQPEALRRKIRFIHLNQSNPALWPRTSARRQVRAFGARVAVPSEKVLL